MVFVPIFILMIAYDHMGWALIVFLLAGLTDALDGLIARHFGQKTDLGALLDPLADKLLLTSAVLILTFSNADLTNRIPMWFAITSISRDVLLLVSVLLISLSTSYKDFPPSFFGKVATFLQVCTVLCTLIGNYFQHQVPYFIILIYLTLGFTLISGLHYLRRGMEIIKDH